MEVNICILKGIITFSGNSDPKMKRTENFKNIVRQESFCSVPFFPSLEEIMFHEINCVFEIIFGYQGQSMVERAEERQSSSKS